MREHLQIQSTVCCFCWSQPHRGITILCLLLATTLLGKVVLALLDVRMPGLCYLPSVRVFCFYQLPLLILYMYGHMKGLCAIWFKFATRMTRCTVKNCESASGRRLSRSITHTTSTVSAPASLSAGLASTHDLNLSCSRYALTFDLEVLWMIPVTETILMKRFKVSLMVRERERERFRPDTRQGDLLNSGVSWSISSWTCLLVGLSYRRDLYSTQPRLLNWSFLYTVLSNDAEYSAMRKRDSSRAPKSGLTDHDVTRRMYHLILSRPFARLFQRVARSTIILSTGCQSNRYKGSCSRDGHFRGRFR